MKHLLTALCLIPSLLLAAPRAPQSMRLDENTIHAIPIHTETNTLLVFPKDVTLILGHHLTRGDQPGKVYCQQADSAKLVILRQLEAGSVILMQVVMNDRAYVFKLSGSDKPASVIRFHAEGQAPPAVEIAPSDLSKTKRTVSDERMEELVRLTKEAAFLKPRLSNEYEGFTAKKVDFTSWPDKRIWVHITGVARFKSEDAIILTGLIGNVDRENYRLPDTLYLKVGGKRRYKLTTYTVKTKALKTSTHYAFSAVLIGDGEGGPLHLSLENKFALETKK